MSDFQEREEEVLVLNSIFNNDASQFFFDSATGIGQISVEIPVEKPIEIICQDENFTLSCLPPVTINFELPQNYPSSSSPKFTLHCDWLSLSQLDDLDHILATTSVDHFGSPILFICIDATKEYAQTLLTSPLNLDEITSPPSLPSKLRPRLSLAQLRKILLDFDERQKETKFASTLFDCEVCFSAQLGKDCVQFHPCSHVFCTECAQGYVEMRIHEGDVFNLSCLASGCDSEFFQTTIRALVSDELFERYDHLLFRRTLARMGDVEHCPRPNCQSPVLIDEHTPTLGQCSVCNFSFCTLCQRAFHGVEKCSMGNATAAITRIYQAADPQTRADMEKKFGRIQLLRLAGMLGETPEERIKSNAQSETWVNSNTKSCPYCSAKIEKDGGCYNMYCTNCEKEFNWQNAF